MQSVLQSMSHTMNCQVLLIIAAITQSRATGRKELIEILSGRTRLMKEPQQVTDDTTHNASYRNVRDV